MIVCGPDIPEGRRCKTAVTTADIFPTVFDSLGEPCPDVDGNSLISFALSEDNLDRVAFSEFHACGALEDIYMIRCGKYKYVYYHNLPEQLFDLKADPYEINDISGDETGAAVCKALKRKLLSILDPQKIDQSCRKDQKEVVDMFSGESGIDESVLWTRSETPVPEEYLK